jgi:hypothetical protein
MVAGGVSLFRGLGGQLRGPGASYRKNSDRSLCFFYGVLTIVPISALPRLCIKFNRQFGSLAANRNFSNPSQKNTSLLCVQKILSATGKLFNS